MIAQSGFKQFTEGDESAEISYKFPGAELSYSGICLNMSGEGILFKADQFIERGRALEVTIVRQNAITPSFTAYVDVISSDELGSDMYEVATEIKGIREI